MIKSHQTQPASLTVASKEAPLVVVNHVAADITEQEIKDCFFLVDMAVVRVSQPYCLPGNDFCSVVVTLPADADPVDFVQRCSQASLSVRGVGIDVALKPKHGA